MLHLLLFVVAQDDDIFSRRAGGGRDDPYELKGQIEDAVLQRQDFNGVPLVSITATTLHGIVTFPAGSTVSVSGGVITSSSVDYAAENDVQLWFGNNVVLGNGGVTASTIDEFSVCGVSLTGINNLNYNSASQTLTFGSAAILFLNYPLASIEDAASTTITFNNCVIAKIETVFNKDAELVFQNPLSSNSNTFLPNTNFADLDSDGLGDSLEDTNGLNKNNKDTDGDGLDDYDEMMRYPTDAKNKNTLGRSDKESVELMANGSTSQFFYQGKDLVKELNLSKNNFFVDSDHDGISDIKEATLKYDYKNNDMDDDGLNDGFEVRHGLNPKEQNRLDSFLTKQCTDCLLKVKGKEGDKVALEFNSGSFTAVADEGMMVSVGNADKNVIEHAAVQDDAVITHSITESQETITNTNADTSIHYGHYTDHVRHGSFSIIMDKAAKNITKATLDSPGIYYHDVHDDPAYKLSPEQAASIIPQLPPNPFYGDLNQYYAVPDYSFAASYAIYRPANQPRYTITFDNKQSEQDAFIHNNSLELTGIITYQRPTFHFFDKERTMKLTTTEYKNNQTIKEAAEDASLYPIMPESYKLTNVIESRSAQNTFTLTLYRAIQADVIADGKDYDLSFDDVKITGTNATETWNWTASKPNAIRSFQNTRFPWKMQDKNGIITQSVDGKDVLQLYSAIDGQKRHFDAMIAAYRLPQCEEWAKEYQQEETLPRWASQNLH
ncbi:hypothetical protein HYU19_00350 [Candidatus Woesearchaeota archaeon]|nr:hypothetical protein [Candidatus Woesearchaeota archaeon]